MTYLTAAWRFAPVRAVWTLALIALLVLAGCGQAQPSPQPDRSPVPTGTQLLRPGAATPMPTSRVTPSLPAPERLIAVSPEALEGEVIQFWHLYAGESQVLLDLMAQEFNKTNPWGIQVENTALPGFAVLQTRLREAAGARALPDVWTASTYQALLLDAGGETVADLAPYISDARYGLTADEQRDFLPALWEQERIPPPALKGRANPQGKYLGLPWARNGVLFFYNRTWAQELGFPVLPETPTGFRDQACAAARANTSDVDRQNDGTGGWMVAGEPAELSGWLFAFGAELVREDGRGYQFATPEARQALDFLLQLTEQGCLWQAGDSSAAQALADRRALFFAASLVDLPSIREELHQAQAVDRWQVIPFPSPNNQPAVVSYGPSLILSHSSPERELAGWLFIRWLASPQNQARWAQFNYLFPSRRSALDSLPTAAHPNQDWVGALEYLSYLRAEPYYASWQNVRWSLGDALDQLIALQIQPVQADVILRMLDELAAEIHFQIR